MYSGTTTITSISSDNAFQSTRFYQTTSYRKDDEFDWHAIQNLPRIYVGGSTAISHSVVVNLHDNAILSLTPYQSNYLNVMRITNTKRWGSLAGFVRIFDGIHGEWLARVVVGGNSGSTSSIPEVSGSRGGGSAANKQQQQQQRRRQRRGGSLSSKDDLAVVECVQLLREQQSSKVMSGSNHVLVHLHMGRLKKIRRKLVLEKATELGIHSVSVVDTDYSSRTEPWEYDKHLTHIIEAAEQCERLTVPEINQEPDSWEKLLQQIQATITATNDDSNHCWFICRERSPNSQPILAALRDNIVQQQQQQQQMDSVTTTNQTPPTNVHILIGPEGGWSPDEILALQEIQEQASNVHFVSLGPWVLRTDTAAISAISAVMLSITD